MEASPQILVDRGELERAIADFEAAAAIFEAEGARPSLARVLRGLGTARKAAGRTADGDTALRRPIGLFEEMGIEREAAAARDELGARPTTPD